MPETDNTYGPVCERCNGKGKIRYGTPGDPEPRPFTEGTTIQSMGGWSTRACECVRDLSPIDDKATWWESEAVHRAVVAVPILDEAVEIQADVEVPRNDAGRRCHRNFENSYYPPLITVDCSERMTLHSDTAREIAAALITAADACDKADELAMATVPTETTTTEQNERGCVTHGRINCDACYFSATVDDDFAGEFEECEVSCPAYGDIACGAEECVRHGCMEQR